MIEKNLSKINGCDYNCPCHKKDIVKKDEHGNILYKVEYNKYGESRISYPHSDGVFISYDDTWGFTIGDSQAVSRCPVPLAFCPGKQKLEQNFQENWNSKK